MKTEQIMDNTDNSNKCKGKIFRGKVNMFLNAKGHYVYQERMIPLKRKSCPGCEYCNYLLDDMLPEFINCGPSPIIQNIVDHALYRLSVVNESRDYETGIIDCWDLEFVKIS